MRMWKVSGILKYVKTTELRLDEKRAFASPHINELQEHLLACDVVRD